MQALYDSLLPATTLPVGNYDGTVINVPLAGLFWMGKVFTVTRVINRMGPSRLLFEGTCSIEATDVVVTYPRLGLTDRLRPISSDMWVGYLEICGPVKIWFLLSRTTPEVDRRAEAVRDFSY